jgi:phenylacetate-CoA ligase
MDIARKGCFGCKTCGREFQLLEDIVGRCHDFILTSSGRRISIAALNMHNEVYDHIRQFQFVQEKQGHVVFKIVKKESFRGDETEKIRRELEKKLGHDVELEIVFVSSIDRTNSGKFCFLDQRMSVLSHDCSNRCDV